MTDRELRERIGGRPDLADLEAYRAPQLDAPVKLNTNESPFGPSDTFMQELGRRVAGLELNRYPARDFPLVREGIAALAGTLTERIWAANGSNELLLQLLLAFGGPDRKVITFEPTYTMHGQVTRISGTRHIRARRNPDFSMDLDASVEAIQVQRPDIVFLCSPNNPTGNINTEEQISGICEAAGGLVILDEAYGEFAGASLARLIENNDNLVVTRSFSKAWRLAGARLGYLIAQPWVIEQLVKIRLPYHISSLTQAAFLTAMEHRQDLLGAISTIKHERDRIFRELSTTGGISPYASEANFILFRCLGHDAKQVWGALLDQGVLIRDFSDQQGCEECLRVSIGTKEQNEKFLDALSAVVKRP